MRGVWRLEEENLRLNVDIALASVAPLNSITLSHHLYVEMWDMRLGNTVRMLEVLYPVARN